MASEFVVRSIAEYVALPELEIPPVPRRDAPGRRYTTHKVGFYSATKAECGAHHIYAEKVPELGKCPLPTIVVTDKNGTKKQFRLPISLAPWALDTVAMAHTHGNPLPAEIEFGILEDRHFAQIL